MSKSINQTSTDVPVQQAYRVSIPNMHKCSSADEFSIMVLKALEAVCLHQGCKEEESSPSESIGHTSDRRPHGKLWLQIYSDTCQVNTHANAVSEVESTDAVAPIASISME